MLKFFALLKKGIEKIERLIPINLLSRRAQVRRLIALEEEQEIKRIVILSENKKKEKKDDLDLIIDNNERRTTDLDQPSY